MDILKDEIYDNLDWLSQTTQTIMSKEMESISKIPNEFVLTYNEIVKHFVANLPNSSTINNIISDRFGNMSHITDIDDIFNLEISTDFYIDLDKEIMGGSVKIIKETKILEKELQAHIQHKFTITIRNVSRLYGHRRAPKEVVKQARTLVKMMTNKAKLYKSTSFKKLVLTYGELVLNDMLSKNSKIKNLDLQKKIGSWTEEYLYSENISGLANLYRLKTMYNMSDNPIYSIQEVK